MSDKDTMERNVVFLDRDTLSPETTLRRFAFPHRLTVHDRTAAAAVVDRIANADIVITNKVPLTAAAIGSATRLKLIAAAATGTDNIDIAAASKRGIVVSNIRSYASDTLPEHTMALVLTLRRSLIAYRQSVAAGRWIEANQFCYFDYPIRNLSGSTMGIVGYGTLGRAVADLAEAFGMHVLISETKPPAGAAVKFTPFEELIRRSDVISLHVPLTPDTRSLIGAREFAMMERRPILINTARGGLVDEEALRDALLSGQIAAAGFDVATKEPPPRDHPLMRLLELPNFILTPHIAWASQEAIQRLADQLVDNIDAFVRGEPRNVVGG
jgi:glycerate dehydrogenase